MLESNVKQYWLYLWKKRILLDDDSIVTRVCYGITSNADERRNGYEGHNGHPVEFADLWTGPERPIKVLESKISDTFSEHRIVGYRNYKYEWLTEEVSYEQIKSWIEWELNEFPSITKDDVSK
jgi:hypothetical protein